MHLHYLSKWKYCRLTPMPCVAGAWGGLQLVSSTLRAGGGGRHARGGALSECITVLPAHFFGQQKNVGSEVKVGVNDGNPPPIAVVVVHFWSCDDRYGLSRVGDLLAQEKNGNKGDDNASLVSKSTVRNQGGDDNFLPKIDWQGEKRLLLCIRAVPTIGLVVSLSGCLDVAANSTVKDGTSAVGHHMQRNVDKLISYIQDPFQLSMSRSAIFHDGIGCDIQSSAE